MNIKSSITNIHYNNKSKGIIYGILRFCSVFYGIGSEFKNCLYNLKIIKPKKLNAYVISVGNLTTGGVGKTPIVAEIAKYLLNKGEKVAIISRGYGGLLSNKDVNLISDGEEILYNAILAGDEPYWLAKNTNAIVITSKNRYKAAKYAIDNYNVTKIILDDGFQHRKLHRDMDIVLIDSEKRLGNSLQLPAGPLRESINNIKRSDKIIIVSKNINHSSAESYSKEVNEKYGIQTYICKTEPDIIYNIKTGKILPDKSEIIALSAIGQPEQFFKFLDKYNIREKIIFDDHHIYQLSDIPKNEIPIVTTEKDAVKLKEYDFDNIFALKLKTNLNMEELLNG